MGIQRSSTIALCVSLAMHVVVVVASSRVTPVAAAESTDTAPPRDDWTGDTFDLASLLEPVKQDPGGERAVSPESPNPEPAHQPTPPVGPSDDSLAPAVPTPAQPVPAPVRPAQPVPSQPKVRPSAATSRHGAVGSGDVPSSTASANSPSDWGAGRGSGSIGAVGQRGVRNLAAAFARGIPIANSGYAAWKTLPLGLAGTVDVTLAVDEGGKIASVRVHDADRAPAHMRELVDRTMLMLRAGRFSLSQAGVTAGDETLRLTATISMTDAGPQEDGPGGAFALGHRRPTREQPGMAMFTLSSGRHVEVEVRIVPP